MSPLTQASSPALPRPVRWLELSRLGALVIGLFSALVGVVLLVNHFHVPPDDPLKSLELAAAKEKLRAEPTNESLQQLVREIDLRARRTYFRHLQLNLVGAWLLVGGAALFVYASRRVSTAARKLTLPVARPDDPARQVRLARIARWAIAGSGAVLLIAMLALAATHESVLPSRPAELEKLLGGGATQTRPDVATYLAGWMQNWPRFRGPFGTGVAVTTNAPLTWNAATGEGVIWKSPVPAAGNSSPIIWGDRVFVSGGDAKAREVMCFDVKNGTLLWRKAVPPPLAGFSKPFEVMEDTGWAAPTPGTDGTRVFAIFGTGELAAFDFAGNVVWSKPLGLPENMYGHSTSLLVWQDRLIVQYDQGEPEVGKSRLYAFDTASGREVWQQRRPIGSSWASPIVVEETNRTQIITLGEPWLIAYSVTNGAEIWRADCIGSDCAPSPVCAGGMIFLAAPHKHLAALRADGLGDVTETHIAWTQMDTVPDITSPVTDGPLLFVVSTSGLLGCVDTQTGKTVWEKDLSMDFNASPSLVGDKLYLISLKGESLVLAVGREYKELARGQLGENVHASPAFVGERIFVRGTTNLFCLGGKN